MKPETRFTIIAIVIIVGIVALVASGVSYLEPQESVTVRIPQGTSVPDCENANACYDPFEVAILVGGEVVWINDDSEAHTVTSGTTQGGPDAFFDSGIFMKGTDYYYRFESPGTFNYFCKLHPWMEGKVRVS